VHGSEDRCKHEETHPRSTGDDASQMQHIFELVQHVASLLVVRLVLPHLLLLFHCFFLLLV
jgi:hypothetical protein